MQGDRRHKGGGRVRAAPCIDSNEKTDRTSVIHDGFFVDGTLDAIAAVLFLQVGVESKESAGGKAVARYEPSSDSLTAASENMHHESSKYGRYQSTE